MMPPRSPWTRRRARLATARQQLALTQAGPRVQDVNDARSQVETARVQLEGARANAGQDAVKQSDIAQARASVAQISGDIQQFEVNVADTRIVAPASGLVLKKYKEPNEIVQSATTGFSDAQSIVATLGSRLEVKVGINEVDIAKVHAHAPATITVDALPDASFAGYVTEIAPASTNAFADSSGGSSGGTNSISKFSVKVAFDRYDPRLRSGMSANVVVISQKHSRVVLAPLEAVPFAGARGQVTVLAAGGRQEQAHGRDRAAQRHGRGDRVRSEGGRDAGRAAHQRRGPAQDGHQRQRRLIRPCEAG